jgi:metal-dependent hydrolase (beta-lactamase superfamily II)
MAQTNPAAGVSETVGHIIPLRFHIVFNNVPLREGLQTAWGFACLIEGLDKTVLFDTGSDGDILLSNLRRLGLDAKPIQAIVLSRNHWDHTPQGLKQVWVGLKPMHRARRLGPLIQ